MAYKELFRVVSCHLHMASKKQKWYDHAIHLHSHTIGSTLCRRHLGVCVWELLRPMFRRVGHRGLWPDTLDIPRSADSGPYSNCSGPGVGHHSLHCRVGRYSRGTAPQIWFFYPRPSHRLRSILWRSLGMPILALPLHGNPCL